MFSIDACLKENNNKKNSIIKVKDSKIKIPNIFYQLSNYGNIFIIKIMR